MVDKSDMQGMAQQRMVVFFGSLRKCSTRPVADFKEGLRSKVAIVPFSYSHTPTNRSFHLGPGKNCLLSKLIQNRNMF